MQATQNNILSKVRTAPVLCSFTGSPFWLHIRVSWDALRYNVPVSNPQPIKDNCRGEGLDYQYSVLSSPGNFNEQRELRSKMPKTWAVDQTSVGLYKVCMNEHLLRA